MSPKNNINPTPVTVENKIELPKQNNGMAFWALGISVISLIISSLSTYWIAYPNYSLKIIDANLCFNVKALYDTTYLDSNYVECKFYNDGNRAVTVKDFRFYLSDKNDSMLFVFQDDVVCPKQIEPGDYAESIVKLSFIRVYNPPPQQITKMKYRLPYKNYSSWKMLSDSFRMGQASLPLKREIEFNIKIHYAGNKELKYKRSISCIWPIPIED